MARIEIIGPKNRFSDVLSLLHEHGTLHIEDTSTAIGRDEVQVDHMEVVPSQSRDRERMEDLLLRVKAIVKALHVPGAQIDGSARRKEYDELWRLSSEELANEISRITEEVEDRTRGLAQSQTDIANELALLDRYEPIMRKIQPLARQMVTSGNFDSVALLVERRYKGLLDQLKVELDKITHKQCEIVSTDVDDETTAAIVVFGKAYSEPVHKFLAMENVNQIRLPSDLQAMPFDEAYDTLADRRHTLPDELKSVRTELEAMSEKWFLRLATSRDVLQDKLDEIREIPKFGQTGYAFVITGWVPVDDLPTLRRMVDAAFGEEVIVDQLEIAEEDLASAPVALKNMKVMEPFQTLLGAYGMPKYGTMDATWMLFVFYPIFFGMIVGDMGYGLIMLGIILWLRLRFRENNAIQVATSILGPAATMVIVFGFVYGEFFGNLLGEKYLNLIRTLSIGPLHLPFPRVESVTIFMIIAIGVGVVQILLGLAFGVVNAVRTKSKHHLYERGGLLVFIVAILLTVAIGFATNMFGNWGVVGQIVFAIVAFAGFIFAVRGGGVMGVVESVLTWSHMASYIRIMAVGLAGAIFADAVNRIVSETTNIGLAIVIGVLLHGLNFVIAAFSPTIHALRLNFLEFFGNFYETGTKEYSPFHKTGGERQA
jgi:V/A-type H+/Na+-transporting ATPase subunit I